MKQKNNQEFFDTNVKSVILFEEDFLKGKLNTEEESEDGGWSEISIPCMKKTELNLKRVLTHLYRTEGFKEMVFTKETLEIIPDKEGFDVKYKIL